LKHILDYGDEDGWQENHTKSRGQTQHEYLDKEIDSIMALKSVYSENYKTPSQSCETTPNNEKY
jgi:hypothetical protein